MESLGVGTHLEEEKEGWMAWQLRAPAASPEVQGLIPSTDMEAHSSITPVPKEFGTLTQTQMQAKQQCT